MRGRGDSGAEDPMRALALALTRTGRCGTIRHQNSGDLGHREGGSVMGTTGEKENVHVWFTLQSVSE